MYTNAPTCEKTPLKVANSSLQIPWEIALNNLWFGRQSYTKIPLKRTQTNTTKGLQKSVYSPFRVRIQY